MVLRNVAVLDNEESVKVPARVTVVYASSVTMIRRRLTDLAFSVAGTSLLMLLAASGLAVWGVRRGLEPLRELAAQASAISVHNWNFRPPPPEKMASELAPLSRAIGTVLDRLRESFRQQRDFTSDAAHELKTSVAILKSTLQTLTHRPRAEQEYRDGLEMLLQDCARLEDLLDRMLRLARIEQRAENGTPREITTAELSSTCEAAILGMQRMADARNIASNSSTLCPCASGPTPKTSSSSGSTSWRTPCNTVRQDPKWPCAFSAMAIWSHCFGRRLGPGVNRRNCRTFSNVFGAETVPGPLNGRVRARAGYLQGAGRSIRRPYRGYQSARARYFHPRSVACGAHLTELGWRLPAAIFLSIS